MREHLDKLVAGRGLTTEEAKSLALAMLDEQTPDAAIGAALAALRSKGEDANEIVGFVRALMSRAHTIARDDESKPNLRIDTCGTGGDGAGTFNISTAAAFVCAAAGLNVFKHGNRAASSKCGSADVMEALRVKFHEPGAALSDARRFHFLFAPSYHPALKRLSPLRKSLGIRTIFNLVGPLANPAFPTHQLVGVGARERLQSVANALRADGRVAYVVWGEPGLDEATQAGPFTVIEVNTGGRGEKIMRATDFGLEPCKLENLKGGDATENARIIESVFKREPGARRDVVVLNAALVFLLAGLALYPKEAAALAQRVIDSGAAMKLLDALRDHA